MKTNGVTRQTSSIPAPDGGWGWVVMMASFFIFLVLFGFQKSSGVLFVSLMKYTNLARTEASIIPSLCFSITCCMGIISTSLIAHYTIRRVVFIGGILTSLGILLSACFNYSYIAFLCCYGIITGAGMGSLMLPITIAVHQYFDRHRAFASGFSLSGAAIGSVVIPPLFQYLLDVYGMFGALLIMSAVTLHAIPCSMLYRPLEDTLKNNGVVLDPHESMLFLDTKGEVKSLSASEQKLAGINNDSTVKNYKFEPVKLSEDNEYTPSSNCSRFLALINFDPSILDSPYFYLIGYSQACFAFTWSAYLNVLPDYAEKEGEDINSSMAAFLISATSLGDIFGRVGFGWLSDKKFIQEKHFYMLLLWITGTIFACLSLASSYTSFVAGGALFGLFNGGSLVMPSVLFNCYLGQKRFPAAYGVTTVANGFLIFATFPVIAAIRDAIGSYKICLVVMGCALISAGMCWLVESFITWKKTTKPENPS